MLAPRRTAKVSSAEAANRGGEQAQATTPRRSRDCRRGRGRRGAGAGSRRAKLQVRTDRRRRRCAQRLAETQAGPCRRSVLSPRLRRRCCPLPSNCRSNNAGTKRRSPRYDVKTRRSSTRPSGAHRHRYELPPAGSRRLSSRSLRGGLRAIYWVLTPWATPRRIRAIRERFRQRQEAVAPDVGNSFGLRISSTIDVLGTQSQCRASRAVSVEPRVVPSLLPRDGRSLHRVRLRRAGHPRASVPR